MKSKANHERGITPANDGRGGLFPPGFYKPDTAESVMALHDRFTATDAPAWLRDVRADGAAAVRGRGLPSPVLERWKYTNLPAALRGLPKDAAAADIALRDPAGVVRALGAADAAWLAAPAPGDDKYGDMMLWHLANAFAGPTVVVDIPAEKTVDKPLELTVTGADGVFASPRVLVRLGAGAVMTLVEYHRGAGRYWHNGVAQVEIGPGAMLYHYRLQDHTAEAVSTHNTHVVIAEGGRYESVTVATGAGLARNQAHIELRGAGAHVRLDAVNLLRGAQIGDHSFLVEHIAPDCTSTQTVRSVLDDQARGVFQGKVHVHRTGQRTDGYQLCNSLILSEGAEMDTKPELEIYADDVKCSHGATIGQVDAEALFYLRSRGIPAAAARALLIEGFLAEVVDGIAHENTRAAALGKVKEWLKNGG